MHKVTNAPHNLANDRGQVNRSAAEIYDEFFVPALFAEWTEPMLDAAAVAGPMRVLDVACGTGVLARAAIHRVGAQGEADERGEVVGLDVNDGMLAVPKRRAPAVAWHAGRAESLPFASADFDAVVSQFGLMFFEDRVKAMQEMVRVLRPGGSLALAVWASLAETPGYLAMVTLLQELFGAEVADRLRAPFVLGDVAQLQTLCADAHIPHAQITTQVGTARFPSLQDWVYTDIKGWTLADDLDDDQFTLLLEAAEKALQRFVQPDGTVAFASSAHIITARA